ncbi:MerR family transcriptional regulator [Pararhizobium mangrovi]|uniref:MerR family DNA-binding transcriptional regulator n=1 Tax=Pararhizobium mangrovi TaxID=2590452 RepID=A0A506UCQ3_9HYPH|nr:MerR family DNA-binding transcriptional regulator [Pararhizobium mangrovi]TPW31196.1 MerR family DNA-binding transcriptional regulator [Pararhizobium mangrovi]
MERTYGIGDLTREFDISTRTLRFYEEEGLIQPERRGRTRIYRAADRRTVRDILRGRRLGFTLAEIRDILAARDGPPAEGADVQRLLKDVGEKREAVRRMRRDIDEMLAQLDHVEEACLTRLAEIGVGT